MNDLPISKSPSALQKARLSIELLQAQIEIEAPWREHGSPAPHTVAKLYTNKI